MLKYSLVHLSHLNLLKNDPCRPTDGTPSTDGKNLLSDWRNNFQETKYTSWLPETGVIPWRGDETGGRWPYSLYLALAKFLFYSQKTSPLTEYLESLPESPQAVLGCCRWPGWADATFWQNCVLAATHLALLQSLGVSTGEKKGEKNERKALKYVWTNNKNLSPPTSKQPLFFRLLLGLHLFGHVV